MEIVNIVRDVGKEAGFSVSVTASGLRWDGQTCRCGCGTPVRPDAQYTKSHYWLTHKDIHPMRRPEVVEKMRNSLAGRTKETHGYIRERADKVRGRTKETHEYIRIAAEKRRKPLRESTAVDKSKKRASKQEAFLRWCQEQTFYCRCGCGGKLTPKLWWKYDGIPQYLRDHAQRCQSQEVRRKIGLRNQGDKNAAKRPEVREKIRQAKLGRTAANDAGRRAAAAKMRGRTKYTHPGMRKLSDNRLGKTQFNDERVRKAVKTKRSESGWKPSEEFLTKAMVSRCSNENNKYTKPERYVAEELRRRGIDFVHPYPISRYHADFLVFDNVVIEVDGWTHEAESAKERDARKDAFLSSRGYRVFRLKEHDIYADVVSCVDNVLAYLILAA